MARSATARTATSPRGRRASRIAPVLVPLLLLGACRDPDLSTPPPTGTADPSQSSPAPVATSDGPAAIVADPRLEELQAAVADLRATLLDALSSFEGLARVTSLDDARPTVLRLRAVLAADPRWQDVDGDGEADDLGVRPLLPGPDISREETVDYGDAFTRLLTAARGAGADGADHLDLLRDPIMGDLGAWQRDAEGLLAGIEAAVADVDGIAEAEQAVQSLRGEGPRALAWALLAVEAPDLEAVQAHGERGAVHVQLMLDALEAVQEAEQGDGDG